MSAQAKARDPLSWVRKGGAKYLPRSDEAPAPATGHDGAAEAFGDALREKARDLVSGLATLTHRLALSELSNEALRADNEALRAALAETGRDLGDWSLMAAQSKDFGLADELRARGAELRRKAGGP